jgi:hypothetical protein
MARDEERLSRAGEVPIVGGVPDVPGIVAAMQLTPGLGVHLRALADELLVHDYPGATITRVERVHEDGAHSYIVYLTTSNGDRREIRYSEDGNKMGKK